MLAERSPAVRRQLLSFFLAAAQAALDAADTRCAFSYTVANNATDDRKRTSIAAGPVGNIRVAQDHELVTAVGHLLPTPVAGRVPLTMHLVEFLGNITHHHPPRPGRESPELVHKAHMAVHIMGNHDECRNGERTCGYFITPPRANSNCVADPGR